MSREQSLAELGALAELSQTALESIQLFFNRTSDAELADIEQHLAVGTSELLFVIKPSNRLLKFASAFRARH